LAIAVRPPLPAVKSELLPRQQIAGSRAGLSANLLCWRNPYILPVCAVSPPRISAEILGTLFLLFAAGVIRWQYYIPIMAENEIALIENQILRL
jgi:hypothetical protein